MMPFKHISVSQFELWRTCPKSYHLYALGFKRPSNIHLEVGIKYHKAIENWLHTGKPDLDLPELKPFFDNYRRPAEQILTEEKFVVEWGGLVPIMGYMDVIYPQIGIIQDHKTSRKPLNQEYADTSFQATIYWMMYRERFGEWPKEFHFNVIRKGLKKPKFTHKEQLITTRTPEDVERVKEELHNFCLAVIEGNWYCRCKWYCPYSELCCGI